MPFLSPENLPDPGIEPGSSALQADSLLSEPQDDIQNSLCSFYIFNKKRDARSHQKQEESGHGRVLPGLRRAESTPDNFSGSRARWQMPSPAEDHRGTREELD